MTPKNIKFPNLNNAEFIKELRAEVNEYFKQNNISRFGNKQSVFKTIVMLLLYFLPFVLMLSGLITSFPLILSCWIIMGIAIAGIGMGVMHDANHGSLSQNPKINRFFGDSLYLLGGYPINWRQQHNTMHHGFTNIDGYDEDISPPGNIIRLSPHKPLSNAHRYQHMYAWFLYGLMTISWVISKDFKQLMGYKKDNIALTSTKTYKRLFLDLFISKVLYYIVFVVLPIILLPIPWYLTLVCFIAMHFVAGLILGAVFQAAHVVPTSEFPMPDDSGSMNNSWAIHQLYTTSDFSPKSRILSWYIGGLNYQIEHHLFPNISHVHYKSISSIVKKASFKYELPYNIQPTFVQALRNHTTMLKNLGR